MDISTASISKFFFNNRYFVYLDFWAFRIFDVFNGSKVDLLETQLDLSQSVFSEEASYVYFLQMALKYPTSCDLLFH